MIKNPRTAEVTICKNPRKDCPIALDGNRRSQVEKTLWCPSGPPKKERWARGAPRPGPPAEACNGEGLPSPSRGKKSLLSVPFWYSSRRRFLPQTQEHRGEKEPAFHGRHDLARMPNLEDDLLGCSTGHVHRTHDGDRVAGCILK